MDNNRQMKILFWNVRGINSQEKWDAIRDKISESACQILCIQETKREIVLIIFTSKNSVQETLIPLLSLPLLVHLGSLNYLEQ
jgi:hypothetical protein